MPTRWGVHSGCQLRSFKESPSLSGQGVASGTEDYHQSCQETGGSGRTRVQGLPARARITQTRAERREGRPGPSLPGPWLSLQLEQWGRAVGGTSGE